MDETAVALNTAQQQTTRTRVLGIGEMGISTVPDETLITYSLGSCVGLTLYDPEVGVGGMIHCMLPLSRMDPEKAKARPCLFTDTGIAALIQGILDRGGSRKRFIAKVAGGGQPLDDNGMFKIGERNYTVLRKILWKNNILIDAEDVGGKKARTLVLYMARGTTAVRAGGQETPL